MQISSRPLSGRLRHDQAYFPSIGRECSLLFLLPPGGGYQPTIWRRVVPIAGMHVNDRDGENISSYTAPKIPPQSSSHSVLFHHRCKRERGSGIKIRPRPSLGEVKLSASSERHRQMAIKCRERQRTRKGERKGRRVVGCGFSRFTE